MRLLISTLAVLALTSRAFAGDFDILRGEDFVGPATYMNWSGIYFGGDFGISDTNADFSKSTQAPIAYQLRETTLENEFSPSDWPVLGKADHTASSYGGFVGYNTQWEDVILGIEADYERPSGTLVAPTSPIERILTYTDPNTKQVTVYDVKLSGDGSLSNLDYGSLRARAGWIFGNFLPYGFAGLALGRADVAVTATVNPSASSTCGSPNTLPCVLTSTVSKNGALLYGFIVGAGLDVAVTSHIFLRGEAEYVQFAPIEGVLAGVASAHVGAGLKF
jgi:outer membrane immunogenic protein